jgi:molecular chaperone GrpE
MDERQDERRDAREHEAGPDEALDVPSFDLDAEAVDAGGDAGDGGEAADEDLTDAERIERLEHELGEMKARWMRALADFRNFQQRSVENERQAREDGRTAIVRALMPALDNLDLALAQQATGTPPEQLIGGMRTVAEQFREIFGGLGVTVVRPEAGESFDPHLHAAMLQQPSDEHEPGRVLSVIQSGYTLGERVLRPAGVIVATEPPASGGGGEDDAEGAAAGDAGGPDAEAGDR